MPHVSYGGVDVRHLIYAELRRTVRSRVAQAINDMETQ
jgi:hypothetical protein